METVRSNKPKRRGPSGKGNDIFLNEDLSNPENRINVAMFGLMTQDWFRIWFLQKLGLSTDAVVYPPINENGVRPDLKVDSVDGLTLARIEVELGTNPAQVAKYSSLFTEPIKTVFGRRSHGSDLSLEEIADRLGEEMGKLPPQTLCNVKHLRDQIIQHLHGFSSSSSVRAEVSDQTRDNPLVAGLVELLDSKILFTTGVVPIGYLKADTNSSQGFSLRVNSRESQSGTLSVLHITGGRPTVYFPARVKLDRYLPYHAVEVAEYAEVLLDIGIDISAYGENQKPNLPLDDVVDALDRISTCVAALADRPGR